MEGPSKAEISFEDRKDGSCGVSYIVKEPGTTFFFLNVDVLLICMHFISKRLNFSVILLNLLQFMRW